MKKQYGLGLVIGKRSTLRYPRLTTYASRSTVNNLLPANSSVIEPSFNTALTMKRADPLDVCDQFNENSFDYENDFPIRVKIIIESSNLETLVLDPTVFSILNIVYDLDEMIIERFRADISDILIVSTNLALIKASPIDDFFLSELINQTRAIFGNIKSYNCRRKKIKMSTMSLTHIRPKRYLHNTYKRYNLHYYHKKLRHYFYKTYKYKAKQLLPLLFDRIEYFFDIFEDWDESYDFLDEDHALTSYIDLLEVILLAEEFILLKKDHYLGSLTPVDSYYSQSVFNLFNNFHSTYDSDLKQSFRLDINQSF